MKHCPAQTLTILLLAAVSIMTLTICGGCASSKPDWGSSQPPRERVELSPGDTIDVKFFYASELNDRQVIRPDGLITLQLVGDIKVWGMTPQELRTVLISLYSKLVEKPEVAVIIRELANSGIYVGGAVLRPGRLPMLGHMTALEAIMQSGGFNPISAKIKDVVVLRRDENQYRAFHIDFKNTLKGKNKELFYLHASDIVYVPRTGVDSANQWVDQHINNMIPQFGIRYSRVSGDSTYTIDTSDYRR